MDQQERTAPVGGGGDGEDGRFLDRLGSVAEDEARKTRRLLTRRLGSIMLVRVLLYTLILGGTVAVNLAWGTPEELDSPHVSFLFIYIAGLYALSLVHAALLRFIANLTLLSILQIATDLATSALLVHYTGGTESAFVLLYVLSPIGAAVMLGRRAAVVTAVAAVALFAAVSILGHAALLPDLPGQARASWQATRETLGRSLLVNGVATLAVALLSGHLAAQLRSAALAVEEQQVRIYDLSQLNEDIIRCLTSGLLTVDDEGRVLAMNRSASEILRAQALGRGHARLADLAPELAAQLSSLSEPVRRGEVSLERDGQRVLIGYSVSRLADHRNQGRGLVVNFQDLTSRRQMEERVRTSEQLASLGRMAAAIAHEVRNPLASISGSLELLRREANLSDDDNKLMDISLREIERLNGLVTDFLEYARPRPPRLEVVDLGEEIHVLAGAIRSLRPEAELPEVRVEAAARGSLVRVDRDQLQAVLWNLVRNAIEAGEREAVQIRVGPRGGDRVVVEVRDAASGISGTDLAHVFEPFFTTKAKGTGLGLATVQRIVQEHGGTMEVESTVGEGTAFRILLPAAGTS
jgi:two-component system, NtrC family, sensor histidine kinase PilS